MDLADKNVAAQVLDTTGEVHIGKVASFFGRLRPRLDFVLNEVREAAKHGRKILVLSKSVDALINMLSLWDGQQNLVTDIPLPSPSEVGEVGPAIEMSPREIRQAAKQIGMLRDKLTKNTTKDPVRDQAAVGVLEARFMAHEVFKKCNRLWNKRRDEYLRLLLLQPSTAGLMIGHISADERMKMLREKQVIFCIAKYGREGLDEKHLNTLIINEPSSREAGVQQLLGRVLREVDDESMERVVVFLEDDVGPFIGMCQKVRKLLREWPDDKGGKLSYENLGHPTTSKGPKWKASDLYQKRKTSIRGPGQ